MSAPTATSLTSIAVWAGVALLGGAGAVARLWVDGVVGAMIRRTFPYGTLFVNITGAFGLGVLAGVGASRTVTMLVGTGLLGSYTTFSTWVFETQRLDEERRHGPAVRNVLVSLVLGVAAVSLGRYLGGRA